MNKKNLSLSLKVNLIVFVILISFLMSLYYLIGRTITGKIIEKSRESGRKAVTFYAQINKDDLIRMDYYAIENNTKEFLKNDEIIYAQIYDEEGFPLSLTGKEAKKEINVSKDFSYEFKENIFHNGLKIGEAEIEISTKGALKTIRKLRFVMLYMSLIILASMFFAVFLSLKFLVIRPLSRFVKAVNKVATGQMDFEIKGFAQDEIGTLADNFDEMKKTLSKKLILIKSIINSMPSAMIALNKENIVTEWNEGAVELTGIEDKDAIGTIVWSICPGLLWLKKHEEEFNKRSNPIFFHRIELEFAVSRYFDLSVFPILRENQVEGFVIRIDDMSETESIEQQLRHAQKMETIGTLAGGLAHDFNNVLGGITGAISLIEYYLKEVGDLPKKAIVEKHLDAISKSANRASEMVKQLLSLSRKQEINFIPTDLCEIVSHVKSIGDSSFDKRIELDFSFCKEKVIVNVDPIQIEQLVLNLCVNAIHAMTIMRAEDEVKGGRLSLDFEKIYADKIFCKSHPEARLQEYWVLSISDTGVGMDSKTLTKIFDPFFTTKPSGIGTGLGLSMVYNIVKEHNGFIDVYSELGTGSTFNLYFPALDSEDARKVDVEREKEIFYGKGNVLFIDDDPLIRATAREMLEICGYTVQVAENGVNGLELYLEMPDKFDLVILDVFMPKLSGDEVYKEIKMIKPGQKIMLISALKDQQKIKQILNTKTKYFLQKPFNMHRLSKMVAKAIAH